MYCGFATTNNRIRWSIVFLFWFLAVLAAVGIGVTFNKCDNEVQDELDNPNPECSEEVQDDSIRWNIGRDECGGALPSCTALGSFIIALAGALLLSTLPCCCMCCCANPPSAKVPDEKYGVHAAAPAPGGYDHGHVAPYAHHGAPYGAYDQSYGGVHYSADTKTGPDPYATAGSEGYDAYYGPPHHAAHSYSASGQSYSSAHVPGGPGSNVYSYNSQQYAGTLPTLGASSATASSAAATHHGRHGSGASSSAHGRNPSGSSSAHGQSVTAAGGVPAVPDQAPIGGMVHTIEV